MSDRTKGLIAVIIASVFWSTAGAGSKYLLASLPPIAAAFFRFFIASLAICLLFYLKRKQISIKKLWPVFAVSVFSAGNILLFYLGLSHTTSNASYLIYTSSPLMVALLSYVFLSERLSKEKYLGLFLGLIGVLFVILLPAWQTGQDIFGSVYGNFIIFLAVISWAIYSIGSGNLIRKKIDPLLIAAASMLTNAIIFFFLSIIFEHRIPFLYSLSLPTIFTIIYLGIFVSVIPYVLYQLTVKFQSATVASLTTYLQPPFAVMVNAVFLGEIFSWQYAIGGILTLVGVYLVTSKRKQK